MLSMFEAYTLLRLFQIFHECWPGTLLECCQIVNFYQFRIIALKWNIELWFSTKMHCIQKIWLVKAKIFWVSLPVIVFRTECLISAIATLFYQISFFHLPCLTSILQLKCGSEFYSLFSSKSFLCPCAQRLLEFSYLWWTTSVEIYQFLLSLYAKPVRSDIL